MPHSTRALLVACASSLLLSACASQIRTVKVSPQGPPPEKQAFLYHLPSPLIHVLEKRLVREKALWEGRPVEVAFTVRNWPDPQEVYALQYLAHAGSRDNLVFELENGVLRSINVEIEDRTLEAIGNVVRLTGKLAAIAGLREPEGTKEVAVEYDLPLADCDGKPRPDPCAKAPLAGRRGYAILRCEMTSAELGEGAAGPEEDAIAYRPLGLYTADLVYCEPGDGGSALRLDPQLAVRKTFIAPAIGRVSWVGVARRGGVKRTWKVEFPAEGGVRSYATESGSPAEAATGAAASWPDTFVNSQKEMIGLLQDLLEKQAEYQGKLEELQRAGAGGKEK